MNTETPREHAGSFSFSSVPWPDALLEFTHEILHSSGGSAPHPQNRGTLLCVCPQMCSPLLLSLLSTCLPDSDSMLAPAPPHLSQPRPLSAPPPAPPLSVPPLSASVSHQSINTHLLTGYRLHSSLSPLPELFHFKLQPYKLNVITGPRKSSHC